MPQAKGPQGDKKESQRHAEWVREHPRIDETGFPEYPDEKARRGSSRGAMPNGNPWRPLDPDEKPGRSESETATLSGISPAKGPAPRGAAVGQPVAGQPTHRPAVVVAENMGDERIGHDIDDVLANSKAFDGLEVVVEVDDGEVRLRGTVPDEETKNEAERLSSSVRGVKRILNRLTIEP